MADKYRRETDDPHEACLYLSERGVKMSIQTRRRHAKKNAHWDVIHPVDFTIVPLKLTEETI
ncbi:hypothetical protein NKH33_09615 [Mesorhizobium sp. M1182]|uniref:hypothetical protein n=1 Tax=Mesorhizobium sp. M1182 TaxID=2957067 RepID=UPI00333A20B8